MRMANEKAGARLFRRADLRCRSLCQNRRFQWTTAARSGIRHRECASRLIEAPAELDELDRR